jgi:hypothetical protein
LTRKNVSLQKDVIISPLLFPPLKTSNRVKMFLGYFLGILPGILSGILSAEETFIRTALGA